MTHESPKLWPYEVVVAPRSRGNLYDDLDKAMAAAKRRNARTNDTVSVWWRNDAGVPKVVLHVYWTKP